jgi:hypothetical protein
MTMVSRLVRACFRIRTVTYENRMKRRTACYAKDIAWRRAGLFDYMTECIDMRSLNQ